MVYRIPNEILMKFNINTDGDQFPEVGHAAYINFYARSRPLLFKVVHVVAQERFLDYFQCATQRNLYVLGQ
jgi:hypothetical protein